MSVAVLSDLMDHKIPALKQAGQKIHDDRQIVLFSRSGYDRALIAAAVDDPSILLVDVAAALDS
jgi:hypothetical protein